MQLIWLALQTDYSFLLRFLRFLTSAPLGFLPSTNLVDCVGNCYTSLIFSFFYFSYFSSPWNLKKLFFLLSFFCSLLCSFLLHYFLFKCVFLLSLFSYYSILSTSPLCSTTIHSVLFLLFVIF